MAGAGTALGRAGDCASGPGVPRIRRSSPGALARRSAVPRCRVAPSGLPPHDLPNAARGGRLRPAEAGGRAPPCTTSAKQRSRPGVVTRSADSGETADSLSSDVQLASRGPTPVPRHREGRAGVPSLGALGRPAPTLRVARRSSSPGPDRSENMSDSGWYTDAGLRLPRISVSAPARQWALLLARATDRPLGRVCGSPSVAPSAIHRAPLGSPAGPGRRAAGTCALPVAWRESAAGFSAAVVLGSLAPAQSSEVDQFVDTFDGDTPDYSLAGVTPVGTAVADALMQGESSQIDLSSR